MDCVVLSALLHLASGASEHHARVAGLLVLVESSVCGAERRERSREAKVGSHGFSQGGDSRLRREGLFDFLRPRPEVHVYQVDFQQHPAHERRRARGALRRSRVASALHRFGVRLCEAKGPEPSRVLFECRSARNA